MTTEASSDGLSRAATPSVDGRDTPVAMVRPRSRRAKQDIALALAAGPAHWLGTGNEISTPILWTSVVHFISIGGLASRITHDWVEYRDLPPTGYAAIVVATWLSAALLSLPVVVRMVSRFRRTGRSLRNALAMRVLGVAGLAATMGPVLAGWDAISFWPIIAFFTSDLGLTLIALKRLPTRLPALRRVLWSPAHALGLVVAGMLAYALTERPMVVLIVVALVEVQVFAVYGGLQLVCLLSERYEFELERARQAALRIGHRDRAHWIHDDVISELRFTRLRIDEGGEVPDRVPAELAALEHRLRLRQLEEVLRTGATSIAEILQPYLRLASAAGVQLASVPSYEVGRWQLTADTASLVKRAFAIPITNAIQSCATTLDVHVMHTGGFLQVDIVDDAGGFELLTEHLGRGLSTLDHELAPGGVEIVRIDGGSCVRCRVPLSQHDQPVR